jgi:two-component system nitrogen regulation response regulator NtrX
MLEKKRKKSNLLALFVDDEPRICSTLAGIFSDEGWDTLSASNGTKGLELYKKHQVDLVLLDVWMEGLDGIQTLQKMKEIKDMVPIVVMSGHGNIETAVRATKLGANDFLEKPLSLEKLLPLIKQVETSNQHQERASARKIRHELIGESSGIAAIHRQIMKVAPRNSWVLITGENGTGKEVVAHNIHMQSTRADNAFVAVNCAAIPEELIESELFGHAKGAFTNALAAKPGKFELAHQGTLFLDEIGDMSLKTQAKILRILQEQTFERLGDTQVLSVDVRVIAATNKNLQQEIKKGTFREDLFYRLNVIPIHMPPLRERPQDIVPLVEHFFLMMADDLQEDKKKFSKEALALLQTYQWPGNVRELRNLIERLCILLPGPIIKSTDLHKHLSSPSEPLRSEGGQLVDGATLREARSNFEKLFIMEKLEEFNWNISKTADEIGIERSNLHRKLRTYEIDARRIKT